ncbi:MAG TPA: heme ABC transporter permease [Devosia sp.]|nr:heme ABC transporter permease [Devosia sp.]
MTQTQTTPTKQPSWFSRLAHPGVYLNWSAHLVVPLIVLTIVTFGIGLWYAFFNSPPDYQMGETVRIMYIHVPNAWLSQMVYAIMAVSAVGSLVWRHPLADVSMKAAAPLGAAFTAVALFTGALWGRPTWGTFWEWDGRMTSTLILFLMYIGLVALWSTFNDQSKGARTIAVFTLVGAINIPIIKFSVDWWNTLHQPSIISTEGLSMPASIATPLLVMMLAFTLLFFTLHMVAMRSEILRRRANNLERRHIAQQMEAKQ